MQYSTVFLSLLAATGAMASPKSYDRKPYPVPNEKSVTVVLRDMGEESVVFRREPVERAVASRTPRRGPFQEVELILGEDVQNKDLRCQIWDENNTPVIVLRGNNTDITFADGDKGPWKFRAPTNVKKVICDADFEKIDPEDERLQVNVLLQNDSTGISFGLSGVVENSVNVASGEDFSLVTLSITGELVDPALRCQILSSVVSVPEIAAPLGEPITVFRDPNTDITFADGGKGAWTLQPAQTVSKIVCNPAFKQASA